MLGTLQISFFFFYLSILCWIDLQIWQLNHFMGAKGLPFKGQELVTNLGRFRARRIRRNKTDFKKRACTQHCPSFTDPTPLSLQGQAASAVSSWGSRYCLRHAVNFWCVLGKKKTGGGGELHFCLFINKYLLITCFLMSNCPLARKCVSSMLEMLAELTEQT